MVGIGTVLADDPQLTVRLIRGRDPLRVIIDSHLRIPLASRVLAGGAAARTLVATAVTADPTSASEIQKLGAEILRLPTTWNGSGIDISRLLEELGRRGITSVLVEGGKGIITSLLAARAVDRLVVVIAPKIIGQGTEAIGDLGITRLKEAITFSSVKIRRLGEDVIFDGRLTQGKARSAKGEGAKGKALRTPKLFALCSLLFALCPSALVFHKTNANDASALRQIYQQHDGSISKHRRSLDEKRSCIERPLFHQLAQQRQKLVYFDGL